MSIFGEEIICETSTRADGNMSYQNEDLSLVSQKRNAFLWKHGVEPKTGVAIVCDHGETIVGFASRNKEVTSQTSLYEIQAEVVATQEKGVALFLLTADCIPLCFFDPVTQTIALAHISRKTLSKALPQKTVSFLQNEYGVVPSNLIVHLAPHIHKESYRFQLPLLYTDNTLLSYMEEKNDHVHIDITTACIDALRQSGVKSELISVSPIDTAVSTLHFSYFAQKQKGEITTQRIATILMLK